MDDLPQPGPGECEIAIQNPRRYPEGAAREVRPWLGRLVSSLAPEADSFSVRFAGDRAMRRFNRSYRGKDRTTDVLSFPGVETPEGRHLGDVVVSVPTARRQALHRGHSVEREVRTLLLHGLLHCLGYDHEADDGEMDRLETSLRREWIDGD
jgi:probable rRNA maturation factor